MGKKWTEFSHLRDALVNYYRYVEDGNYLDKIQSNLNFDLVNELRMRLKVQTVTCLFVGAGNRPYALNQLADAFKSEISQGKLRLIASHITPKNKWLAFLGEFGHYPVQFHRTSLNGLLERKITADIVIDHFGPITHTENPDGTIEKEKRLLAPGGVLAYRRKIRDNNQGFVFRRAIEG